MTISWQRASSTGFRTAGMFSSMALLVFQLRREQQRALHSRDDVSLIHAFVVAVVREVEHVELELVAALLVSDQRVPSRVARHEHRVGRVSVAVADAFEPRADLPASAEAIRRPQI